MPPFQIRADHLVVAGLLTALAPLAATAQQGHSISEDAVVVDSQVHWQGWEIAGGTVDISADGVRPRYMRREINAALDAPSFANQDNEGGVHAGSNVGDADFLIDGDIGTGWGPDTDDPLSDWWVELHLGRIVVVEKVVLRFAEEGDGDPFLQFKVLGWRTPPSRLANDFYLSGTKVPEFWELGRTHKPNKSQRVFEFVPDATAQNGVRGNESQISTNELFKGDPLERIHIEITDTDLERAAEIASEEYDALDDDEKGAIDHYRREQSGRESLVTMDEYHSINLDRRGSIRYYRKELPKLAEIEVWTAGDNIILGVVDRGGLITVEANQGDAKDIGSTASDGRYSTGFTGAIFGGLVYDIFVDLGALYWVDTLQFLNDGKSGFEQMAVDVSDGSRAPDGSIKWTRVVGAVDKVQFHRQPGMERLKFRQFHMAPARVRYVRAPFGTPVFQGNSARGMSMVALTELLIYGEGYVPEIELTSGLIQLDSSKNLVSIEWESATPPGTDVRLQTRSGDRLLTKFLYFDSNDNPVDPVDDPEAARVKYERLPKSKKGRIDSLLLPGGDWEPWSAPYPFPGADITSPSPRKYMQIRARLSSQIPEAAASLRSVKVNLADPVAAELVGEVWPTQIEALGRPHEFSFYIRPDITTAAQGFDEVRIEATGEALLEFLETRTGSADEFLDGDADRHAFADLVVMDTPPGAIWFRLPDAVGDGVDLIEVRFRATSFSTSTSFQASGLDSDTPGVWQRVDAGDATHLVDSQTTTVLSLSGNRVIRNFAIGSPVLTPNGDGVNEEIAFDFSVTRISDEQPVTLRIFDLAGAVVIEMTEQRADPRGNYSMAWTGRDGGGNLVPPGIYIAEVEVDAQSSTASATSEHRLVHVAY